MTTTIQPALGHGPWTQQGVGTSPGYDAIDFRRTIEDPELGEGVTSYGTYRVSQRGAGANMSVDINMDDFAYVRGDAVAHQATYKIPPHSATINETITAADAINPRIDRVVLEVKDHQHDAGGANLGQVRVIAGTPTSGATLDNLTGAGAVPNSAILLADVLVAAADTSISDAEIRDRRPFVAGVPPLLTNVDMVSFVPHPHLSVGLGAGSNALAGVGHDLSQSAALFYLPRRIVGATRIRWKYKQSTTALTGSYVLAIHDASGRKLADTGSVAFTGAANSLQARSDTITATTLEPGWYYVLIGCDNSNTGAIDYVAVQHGGTGATDLVPAPNLILDSATGGVTAPTTILGFQDLHGASGEDLGVPLLSLSVG